MTKKTLNALANALHENLMAMIVVQAEGYQSHEQVIAARAAFNVAVDAVAKVCAVVNPRFDRAYFMARVVQGPNVKRQREV